MRGRRPGFSMIGLSPSPWQTMLAGEGIPVDVEQNRLARARDRRRRPRAVWAARASARGRIDKYLRLAQGGSLGF